MATILSTKSRIRIARSGADSLAQGGLSPLELMRITGHSQLNTLTRYFNQTNEQLKKAAAVLDAFHDLGEGS